jgi:hypothetical protein
MLIIDAPGDPTKITSISITDKAFVLLFFDGSEWKTFEKIEENFIEAFNNNCKNENRIFYIIGNKCDKGARQV